jgi:hypothetical protein
MCEIQGDPLVRYESLPGETTCEQYVWATILRCTPQDIINAIGVCPNYLTPEGMAAWPEYQTKLNQFLAKQGYNAIHTYAEADATTTKKVTIRWKNCSLEGKAHHTIVVSESGRIFDPAPDTGVRHESLEESRW